MLSVHIHKIGELAVVECEGRLVQSEAAFKLREAVVSQRNARIVILEGGEHPRISAPIGPRSQHSLHAVRTIKVCT